MWCTRSKGGEKVFKIESECVLSEKDVEAEETVNNRACSLIDFKCPVSTSYELSIINLTAYFIFMMIDCKNMAKILRPLIGC
jgi:hypothetical protein